MLYQEALDMAYAAISDNETDQFFITTDQMSAFVSKALREMVESTEYDDTVITDSLEIGDGTFTPLEDLSRVWRVEVDGQPLRTTTQGELRRYGVDWRSHTGLPRYYFLDEIASNPDHRIIGLYPASNAVYSIRVTVYGYPAALVAGTEMSIPDWCAEAVVWSMLADCYMVDTEIQNIEVSAFYRYLFESTVDRLRSRSFDRLPKAWSYQKSGEGYDELSVWNNFPEEIPAP